MYYKGNKIMSYNLRIMAVIGARGIGKTYWAKRYCIKKFINESRKFMWVRDTEVACDELRKNDGEKFFADVKKEFKKCNGKIQGDIITINDKHAGYLMPMSTYYNYKGNSYEDIQTIVFDEFIPEKYQRNVAGRAGQFINTIQTIGRLRKNYKVILLANALDRGNDILSIFNIKIKDFGFYFNKKKDFVLHYCDNNPAYNQAMLDSLAGKLAVGTQYAGSIIGNKFADDTGLFFDRKPSNCKLFSILHDGENNSVRVYFKDDKLYVTKDFNSKTNRQIRFVNDIEQVDTTKNLIPKIYIDAIKRTLNYDGVRFENANCKNIFMNFIKNR